jgi:predicted GNAT superfamily acetyltransferase
MNDVVAIRLATPDEMPLCLQLQRDIWGGDDVVPLHVLLAHHAWGGHIQLAWDGTTCIGFSYAYPALHNGELVLHSDSTGILSAWRDRGIGTKLKLAQAEWARRHGYKTITWTFDPLEARNAKLNIRKLGAIVREYFPNFYLDLNSTFAQGLPSHRVLAEWGLMGNRQQASRHKNQHTTTQTCEIPRDFQSIRQQDLQKAARIQDKVCADLQAHFSQGLMISGFFEDSHGKCYYELTPRIALAD